MVHVAEDASGGLGQAQAAYPRRMCLDGEFQEWLHLADGLAAPGVRGGLHRVEHFVAATRSLLEERGGFPPERVPVAYCMPPRAAHRLALARLGFDTVTNAKILTMDPAWLPQEPVRGLDVTEVRRFPAETDELFERGRVGKGAVDARTAEALNWRFVDRPGRTQTHLFLAERAGELVGYAVLREQVFDGHDFAWIVDWWNPGDDPEVGRGLRASLASAAVVAGRGPLAILLPETSASWLEFQSIGFHVQPTSFYIAARTWHRRRDVNWMFWNWYFTLADFDA